MNFYKFLFKKISLSILGVFITLSFCYLLFGIFIENKNFDNDNKNFILINLFWYLVSIFTFKYGKIHNSILLNAFNNPASLFFHYLKVTILLIFIVLVISIIIGFWIGVFLAYKANTLSEIIINSIILSISSIPTFILAPLGIVFSEKIDYPINFIELGIIDWVATIQSMVIPIIILSIGMIAIFSILVRKVMINILQQDFVIVAKANGFSNSQVFWKTIFKNLIIELLNYLIPFIISLLSFSLIIERIFVIPGQGLLLSSVFKNGELDIFATFIFFNALFLYLGQTLIESIYQILKVDNKLNFVFTFKSKKSIKALMKGVK